VFVFCSSNQSQHKHFTEEAWKKMKVTEWEGLGTDRAKRKPLLKNKKWGTRTFTFMQKTK